MTKHKQKTSFPSIHLPLAFGVDVLIEGQSYKVTGDTINFMKHEDSKKIIEGTTNEQLLTVLIHRTEFQNMELRSLEGEEAIWHMKKALLAFNNRTNARKEQGVSKTLETHIAIEPN